MRASFPRVEISSPATALRRMSEAGEAARFYRALRTTYSSGLPLTQALELLASPEHEGAARRRALSLKDALARGETLADGARGPPFIELEHALLELGEQSGSLTDALDALARFFEADQRLALKIKARAVGPFIRVLAGCFILPLPLLFFTGAAAYLWVALPAAALAVLSSGLIMSAAFSFIRGRPRYAIARMLWALAIAIEAGLTIDRAVRLAAAALGPCETARRLLRVPPRAGRAARSPRPCPRSGGCRRSRSRPCRRWSAPATPRTRCGGWRSTTTTARSSPSRRRRRHRPETSADFPARAPRPA